MNISRKHKKQSSQLENFSDKMSKTNFCRKIRRDLKYDMKCVRTYERNNPKQIISSVYGTSVSRNNPKQIISSVYGTSVSRIINI